MDGAPNGGRDAGRSMVDPVDAGSDLDEDSDEDSDEDTDEDPADAGADGAADAGGLDGGGDQSPDVVRDSRAFELLEEDGLPIVHLWTASNVDENVYTDARLVYGGREYHGVQAKFRGKTSLKYPKKSYTIKFDKDQLFDDDDRGFPQRRRFVLTTTFDDTSYVRQRLAFELWNRLHPQVTVLAYNVVVYLNGRYYGLYLLGDHVDDELMERHGLWSGGNLYKARTHDANLRLVDRYGDPKPSLDLGYTKEEGDVAGEPGAFDDLHALVSWVATAPEEQLLAEYESVLSYDYEAWLVLVSAIDAADSAGKNGYLYHDPRAEAPDARWHYVPWDFNASFGQSWETVRRPSTRPLELYTPFNALFEHFANVPVLHDAIVARFRAALDSTWAPSEVLALYDAYHQEIAAAALHDESVWGESVRAYNWHRPEPLNDYPTERDYVRAWLVSRWEMLEAKFPR